MFPNKHPMTGQQLGGTDKFRWTPESGNPRLNNGGYVTVHYHDTDPILNKNIHVDTHNTEYKL